MKKLLFASLLILIASAGFSQTETTASKQAIEVNVLWPIFPGNAYRVHYTRTLWQKNTLRGDLITGLSADLPRDRETEGRFADYSVVTGYRQYLWKGLHVEFLQTTGLGILQNHVTTGKTYHSFDWLVSGYAGYKYDIPRSRFYALAQFGVANVIYKSNPWPIYETKSLEKEVGESPFPLGTLVVGFKF
jgi:hypothetical protein